MAKFDVPNELRHLGPTEIINACFDHPDYIDYRTTQIGGREAAFHGLRKGGFNKIDVLPPSAVGMTTGERKKRGVQPVEVPMTARFQPRIHIKSGGRERVVTLELATQGAGSIAKGTAPNAALRALERRREWALAEIDAQQKRLNPNKRTRPATRQP